MGSKLPSFSHLERVTLNGGCPLDSGGLHGRNYGDIECGRATSLPTREVNVSWAAHGQTNNSISVKSAKWKVFPDRVTYIYNYIYIIVRASFRKCTNRKNILK